MAYFDFVAEKKGNSKDCFTECKTGSLLYRVEKRMTMKELELADLDRFKGRQKDLCGTFHET